MQLLGKPKNRASYVPTGRIWPSGDFSVGYRKVECDRRVDYRSFGELARVAAMPLPTSGDWFIGEWGVPAPGESVGLSGGIVAALDAEEAWANINAWEDAQGAAPLDLTTPRNSHKAGNRPEKYGKLGITAYGRKMVKSAATLMQKMPGKRLTFATITLPSLPVQLRRELALCWPEFLRQLLQTLSRKLKKVGLPALVCSVSEIQPGRLSEYAEGYLHLHLVWPNHPGRAGNWAIDCQELKSWCSEFLQKRGLWADDAWVNVDTQRVKKTAAGYLAKYMSKGVAEIEEFAADCGWDSVPGQWWNLSKPARDLVKKFTYQGDAVGSLLDAVINHSLEFQELHLYHVLQPAILAYDGCERIAGWYGVLVAEFRLDLVKMIKSFVAQS